MSYVPPDLSLEIALQARVSAPPDLSLDVVLCAPDAPDANLDVAASAALQPTTNLSLQVFEKSDGYTPPPLSTPIVLKERLLLPPMPLDVLLCKPASNGNDVLIAVTANAQLDATANASFEVVQPEPVAITVAANATLAPVAAVSIEAEAYVVGVSANIVLALQPTADVSATYDVNVFRGAVHDVSSDMQCSKIQGIGKSGGFENSTLKAVSGTDSKETAKLLSVDSQAQFEANIKLTTSEQFLTEQSKLVGTDSKQLYESQSLVDTKLQLKNETAKKASHSNWYSFEAMLARQPERKVRGE